MLSFHLFKTRSNDRSTNQRFQPIITSAHFVGKDILTIDTNSAGCFGETPHQLITSKLCIFRRSFTVERKQTCRDNDASTQQC